MQWKYKSDLLTDISVSSIWIWNQGLQIYHQFSSFFIVIDKSFSGVWYFVYLPYSICQLCSCLGASRPWSYSVTLTRRIWMTLVSGVLKTGSRCSQQHRCCRIMKVSSWLPRPSIKILYSCGTGHDILGDGVWGCGEGYSSRTVQ